jgi:Predicted branched-chain amino acid permease (azaleucine resistance)
MPSSRAEFFAGARESTAVVLAAAPFGVLFGALAVDNGLTVGEAVFMSAAVFAGASQMVGIELFGSHVVPWLIVFSIFAVNFRHVLYSASIGRHFGSMTFLQKALAFFLLVDPLYAAAEVRVERKLPLGFAWYLGMGVPLYLAWVAEAWVGAIFGGLIPDPEKFGIDFLLPIYFLGILIGFRKRPNWLPVVLASSIGSIIAFKLVGSPWHVSLGAIVGIITAVCLPTKDEEADPVPAGEGPEDLG